MTTQAFASRSNSTGSTTSSAPDNTAPANQALSPHRILVIEDDPDIASLIRLHLQSRYADVQVVSDGLAGFELARQPGWSLVVLDLQLPGKDGLEICRDLRGQGHQVPVLMLTSRSGEMDRVLGLEMGADDYLLKPFSLMELLARINAILRRLAPLSAANTATPAQDSSARPSHEELVHERHQLVLNLRQHRVSRAGRNIELTNREFDLLSYFMQHPDDAFSRTHLLDRIWGQGQEGYEHTVNSHINRLRAKIEDDPSAPRIIVTVWGVGYRLG